MKKRRSLVVLLALLFISIIGVFAVNTYSRYSSDSGEIEHKAEVAKWAVKVNGTDITQDTFTVAGDDITWATNSNVVDGKIAPGRSGSFDVEIDPTGAEVSIDYTIALGTITNGTSAISNDEISISSVKVGDTTLTADSNGKYTGTITLTDTTKAMSDTDKVTVTVTITWTNDDTNNDTDTDTGTDVSSLVIPVTVTAQQHID